MNTIDATDARLSTHEQVCAFRYEQINARLKRLEGVIVTSAGLTVELMATTATQWYTF